MLQPHSTSMMFQKTWCFKMNIGVLRVCSIVRYKFTFGAFPSQGTTLLEFLEAPSRGAYGF